MLLRMYVKYAYKQNWKTEIVSEVGTSAGIKSAILELPNKAKVLANSENGVHRLTRVSPFGNGKLQTSFASVNVLETMESKKCTLPRHEVEETNYKGSGPGGQAKNKSESGVRLRHRPSGLLVEICTERSQTSNREKAWSILDARWDERKRKEAEKIQQDTYAKKTGVAFGYQVRTYKLDKSMVVDDRTGNVARQVNKVLDGDLGVFVN